jgi:flagella basal body P-ring formation protein FlgA
MTMRQPFVTLGCAMAACVAAATAGATAAPGLRSADVDRSAVDAIRAAVAERLGDAVDVRITSMDIAGDARVFREARPHPSARLGKPVRFTLVTNTGAALPTAATIEVVGPQVVTTRTVDRGESLTVEDLQVVRSEIVGVPLQRLPALEELVGARALRRLPAGETVLANAVTVRRTVEPGDRVTVVAAAGAVEVTASFVAADGGGPGAVIRVVNPATRRYLRGRVTHEGTVEVLDGR